MNVLAFRSGAHDKRHLEKRYITRKKKLSEMLLFTSFLNQIVTSYLKDDLSKYSARIRITPQSLQLLKRGISLFYHSCSMTCVALVT